MKIKHKLILNSTVCLTLIVLTGMFGYVYSDRYAKDMDTIKKRHFPLYATCKDLKFDVVQVQQWLTDISATRGLNGLNDGIEKAAQFKKEGVQKIQEIGALVKGSSFALDAIKTAFETYYNVGLEMASGYIQYGPEVGNKLMLKFDSASESINTKVDDICHQISKEFEDILIMQVKEAERAQKIYLFLVIFACVAGLSAAVIVGLHVTKPLGDFINALEGFNQEEGNLQVRINEDRKDEMGAMASLFNRFVEKLNTMVLKFTRVNEQVTSSAAELYMIAEETAKAAVTQHEKIDSVLSSMTQMSEKTMEVAKNAHEASETAKNATSIALKGRDLVNQAINVMDNIRDRTENSANIIETLGTHSNEIGDIVKVINEIAEQTNLLALNAAIEAARAGEQGRGFAVVADEVRKLSENTSTATNKIDKMIKTIQQNSSSAVVSMKEATKEVLNGVNYINQAGITLKDIVSMSEDVTEKIVKIASATEHQSSTADEIANYMEIIADVSKELVKNAKRNAGASQELSVDLTSQLETVFNQFMIAENAVQLSHDEIDNIIKSVQPLIEWKDEYSVGIQKFDDQHKELFRIINNLYAAMKKRVGNQVIYDILSSLFEYTYTHFGAEEEVMNIYGYPQASIRGHLEEHLRFIITLNKIKDGLKKGYGGVNLQLLNTLKDWTNEHILKIDKQYGEFFKKRGIKIK
ncbi:MAG: bacteriohemerythrin [Candidatus Magnetoovum sp. WYHC-5]|nr:bacteriohemerythrin [Candidatus Magnetoovum sp. WYHC-5]